MNSQFCMEVKNSNTALGLLEGDEVIVSTEVQPSGNGKDLAVFEIAGELFISTFTRLGNQIMLLGERIQVVKAQQVKIIGKVTGGSFEAKEKAAAGTATLVMQ